MSEEKTVPELGKSKKENPQTLFKSYAIGAIAASIWQRQSPSGYAYYDFSLSRS